MSGIGPYKKKKKHPGGLFESTSTLEEEIRFILTQSHVYSLPKEIIEGYVKDMRLAYKKNMYWEFIYRLPQRAKFDKSQIIKASKPGYIYCENKLKEKKVKEKKIILKEKKKKTIYLYDVNNVFIKEFNRASDAAKELPIDISFIGFKSLISKNLNGIIEHAKGYRFSYEPPKQ